MATAAGFFGITYQGAVNGLASVTLSVFNMDHPDDRAWLKLCYDHVTAGSNGQLPRGKIGQLLTTFYRERFEGPTQSGGYLHSFPEAEAAFIQSLYSSEEATATIDFPSLLAALQDAQADFAEPSAPLEYGSNSVLRNDKVKHTRPVLHPQQLFRKPMTTSQEVGWELYAGGNEPHPAGTPFHLRTSATTQFADAMEKQTWGRSIGGEFSAYASRKLTEFGGLGMGV